MDIVTYSSRVKTFNINELNNIILTTEVGAEDVLSNIGLIKANLNLEPVIESWFITKNIERQLSQKGYRSKLLDVLQFSAKTIQALNNDLKKLVGSYKEKVWDGKVLTIKQSNLLNTIEYNNFWLKYTQAILDTLVSINNGDGQPDNFLTKHDSRWINGTVNFFTSYTLDLMGGSKSIVKKIELLPDAPVEETTVEILEETEGKDKIDFLKQGFGVHLINPIFWINIGRSKLHIARIEQMRRRNEQFAMKISQAINQQNETPDPQLDRRIEIYQQEIIKNEEKIAKIEEMYE